MESYQYHNRTGLQPITWQLFHSLVKGLAQAVAPFQPQVILPIGRGGYYPGTLLSHLLQTEIYPIRLTRRVNDQITHATPRWLLRPPDLIRGQRVLIVDEICDTGETLRMAAQTVKALAVEGLRSAVLYSHTQNSDIPDFIGLISDALILNPWDREILVETEFHFHPEYLNAMNSQNLRPDLMDLLPPTAEKIAKASQ